MKLTNGSSNGRSTMSDHNPAHPLDGVVAETPANGPILQMHTGLFELGRKRARLSGTTKPVLEDVRSLEDHARAMARETYRDCFDPAKHTHDRIRRDDFESDLNQRNEAQQGESHARANLREAEGKLARTRKAGERPAANRWLVAAFIVAITMTVAPTFHDFVFHTLADDLLAWFGSLASAGFVAAMLTLTILSGRRTAWTWVGVAAGVILGLGLGAIRLSSADGPAESIFAIGFTIVEIAAVLLLESLASGLRNSEDHWIPLHAAESEAIATRDVAVTDLSRWKTLLEEFNARIERHIAYVEDRFNRNSQLPQLEADAIKAVLDGYNAGITENIGRLRGAIGGMQ
jgi:hypothetical protein